MASFGELLHGGVVTTEELQRVRDTVIFEPPDLTNKLVKFYVLLLLASAISTFGLLSDSVAAVIGAMIVAPLMLPIMGLAFGVSIGDRSAIVRSLIVSFFGIAAAIATGFLLAQIMPASFDPEQVGQIMSRTSPRMLDLLAALATGLAGAFAIGRKDVSDTLPGVAIAISLVPPLANVGILLATGRSDLAIGSMLLFTTNYLAILLTGSLVLGLMKFPSVYTAEQSRRSKRVTITIAVVMIIIITVPLAYQSFLLLAKNRTEHLAKIETEAWLEDTDFVFISATASEDELSIVIAGNGMLPPESELIGALDGNVYGLPVSIEAVLAKRIEFDTR